jgi:phage shock protein C
MTTNPDLTMSTPNPLRRRAHGRVLGGVCGAIADQTGLDVGLVRVLTVLVALMSGVGIALYLAAWVLIPVQGQQLSPAERRLGRQVA